MNISQMPQMTEEYFVYNQNDVQPEFEISQHYEDVGNPRHDPVCVTTKEKGNFNSDIQKLGRQGEIDSHREIERDMHKETCKEMDGETKRQREKGETRGDIVKHEDPAIQRV